METRTEKRKVCIIGNNANGGTISDGGRIKIRLYQSLLRRSCIECDIVDLYKFYFHLFAIFKKIKKAIKEKCVVLIMAGPRGCRIIIPILNYLNRKTKTRIVFCPLGIGTIDVLVKKMDEHQLYNFMNCVDDCGVTDSRMKKELEKLDLIIPQNKILVDVYGWFYGLKNVSLLNNFRDADIVPKEYKTKKTMHLIYLSRVCKSKGVFDLIKAVTKNNEQEKLFYLDIFGELQLKNDEKELFFKSLSDEIKYNGVVNHNETISLLKKYDLFVFPTKYHGEGTPGSLIEAFISGTPVLVSSYNQSRLLIQENSTGFIFSIGNENDLADKLTRLYNNQSELERVGKNAQRESAVYTYQNNKNTFLKMIMGENNENINC